jgi:hypothetical protein
MKTKFTALLAAVICGNMAMAQSKVDVPPHITADFAKKYPTATKVQWEIEEGKYQSSFRFSKKEMYIVYNPGGGVEETETVISRSGLPAKAREYVKGKGRIKEVGRIEMANGTIRYEAELKGKDLIFDDKGNFLEEKIEKDDDKG